MSNDNVQPQSIESEQAVLGSCLVSGVAIPDVVAVLLPEHFYRTAHQQIYTAMLTLDEQGTAVDLITLRNILKDKGQLESVGGAAYVSSLTDGVPRSTNVEHYASIVLEKYRLRQVISLLDSCKQQAYSQSELAEVVADNVARKLADAQVGPQSAMQLMDAAKSYAVELNSESVAPLATGYLDIDQMLGGGIRKGTFVIVAARPSVGKTTLVLRFCQSMAWNNHGCIFFSLELGIKPVAGRVLSWLANISQPDMEQGKMQDGDFEKLGECISGMHDKSLVIDQTSNTISQIRSAVRKQKQLGMAVDCVAVDYLQLMAAEHRRGSITEEVSMLSRSLKRLAQSEDVAVVALSQLSRAPEGRADKRPHLSDLRDSGALEQDADVAVLLFREEMYSPSAENEGLAEAIIAKNRMTGATGTVPLVFDKGMAIFRDKAQHEDY